ncbi:MAG: type II secretion system protein J [Roseburia sp.]
MLRKNNKGLTLVEMLLAMAITAILGVLVTGFIIYTTRSYGKSLNESTLQEDAQVILAQLNNYIINADETIEYKVNDVLCKSDSLSGEAAYNKKQLIIYKNVGGGKTVEYITWFADMKQLTYRMDSIDASGVVSTSIDEQILATKIADFQADLTKLTSSKQVKVALTVEGTSGSVYTADTTIYLRNGNVAVPGSGSSSTPVVSTVTSVTVIPSSKVLRPGESWDFNARVYGTNNPSQEVTWTIENNLSPLTTVDAATGEVYLSPSEEAETIVVRATSVQDTSVSGIGYVYVDLSTKLSLGTIRDYWIYTGNTLYLYGRPDGNLESGITWEVETSLGTDSYTLTKFDSLGAASFKPNQEGVYTVRISGIVDGVTYKDKAIIHVMDMGSEYNVYGNRRDKISIEQTTDWDYWLCAGESLTLNTTVDESDSTISLRTWSSYSSTRILDSDYKVVASGDNNEQVTVTVSDTCRTGEIFLRVTVGNEYMHYYDEVTIHVYEPFDYPYIIETLEMDDIDAANNNAYFLRNMVAGPVRIAETSEQLKVLNETNLTTYLGGATTYQLLTESSGGINSGDIVNLPTAAGFTNASVTSSSGSPVKIYSGTCVNFGSQCDMLVVDCDLSIEAPKITTAGDTVIWVKGNHTLTFRWGDMYFDGLIYAPEGTVNIDCSNGMFRGVIIAKNVNIAVNGWGNDELGFMEKQSVMDLINDTLR